MELTLPRAGLTLRGQRWGRPGGIPTLCLHGWLDNSASFEPLVSQLTGLDLDLVAVDLPGHGLSDPISSATCQYLDYAAVALEAAQVLGWSRFQLIGHSLGAALSTLVAGVHPEKITRLVLIDAIGPLSSTPDDTRTSAARYLRAYLDDEQNPVYRSPMHAVKARVQLADMLVDTAEQLIVRDLQPVPGGYSWRSDARLKYPFALTFTEDQVLAFIRNIQAPTLLITAERTALREDYYANRIASLPGLRHVVLPGGHHLHMENVDEVADEVRQFLTDVGEQAA